MLRKRPNNNIKITLVILLVILLVLVRAFEEVLFYDPFTLYFKGDYLNLNFPKFNGLQLFFGMTFRYFINAIISIAIIHVLFFDSGLTKFAAALYLIFYVILIGTFFSLLEFSDNGNNLVLFYVRRFLIQPLLLILFVPAFYYQKRKDKK